MTTDTHSDTHSDTIGLESWHGFAASVPGNGHIRYGIPCQDASLVVTSPRPAIIVCDGRGSAKLSHYGAQAATVAFRRQIAILEPFLKRILDREEAQEEQWTKVCRIMYRTLMQAKYELSEQHGVPEQEFDFTVVFAIVGTHHIGCFQVGDGALVLRQDNVCQTVFLPDKGEYVNQTRFLRSGGEERMMFQHALRAARDNSGIAALSDGPEYLMLHLADMEPGKIFHLFFDDLKRKELKKQDIMDYLTRKVWADDPRGADDRSLAVLVNTAEDEEPRGGIPAGETEAAETDGQEDAAPEPDAPGTSTTPAQEPPSETADGEKPASGDEHAAARGCPLTKKKILTASGMLFLTCSALGGTMYGMEQSRLCESARAEARAAERACQQQRQEIGVYEQKLQLMHRRLLEAKRDLLIHRSGSLRQLRVYFPITPASQKESSQSPQPAGSASPATHSPRSD